MGLSSTLIITICILFCSIMLCAKENKIRNEKQALKLLKYLRGYEIEQDYALALPALILSPVIIIPLKSYKNDPKITSDDTGDQTSSNMKREVISLKPVMDNTSILEENYDIDVNFRQALNRGSVNKDNFKINEISNEISDDDVSNSNNSKENVTIEDNAISSSTTTTEDNELEDVTPELQSTINSSGDMIEVIDVMVSNDTKIPGMLEVPPDFEERWKNFTLNANITILENNTEQSPNNQIEFPSGNETSTVKGLYSAAPYNNAFVDQLSITTNSYINEESPLPPPRDDRWRSFSSLGEMLSMPSGFRPLAGLYYDGFLDRPLIKMPGFVPYNKMYLV